MTTGDCCHLPGSLCDCPGGAALSKSVEDSDMGRPQFVTQVTTKDGRLLSTVIKALGAQRSGWCCSSALSLFLWLERGGGNKVLFVAGVG